MAPESAGTSGVCLHSAGTGGGEYPGGTYEAGPKYYSGRTLLQDEQNQSEQPNLQASTLDRKVWDYHYWLAESLARSGNIPDARTQYQEALRLNPDSTEAKMRLAALEEK